LLRLLPGLVNRAIGAVELNCTKIVLFNQIPWGGMENS
jgi:hypothetical protein